MRRSLLIMAAAVSLLLSGCERDPVVVHLNGADIDTPRDQSSPTNVIENLALAHRLRDIELYKRQLDPSFMVQFSRTIGSDEFGWSNGMSYEDDILSTTSMFNGSTAIEFEMAYEKPVPSEVPSYPASEGYWQIRVHSVNISIRLKNMDNTYVVSHEETMYVLKDCSESRTPEWRAVYQMMYWPGDEPGDAET